MIKESENKVFLFKFRVMLSIVLVLIGLYLIINSMFVSFEINSIITLKVCGALNILTGIWSIAFVKKFSALSSFVSWVLLWFAYFIAYDYLSLRLYSYIFVAIGGIYLACMLFEYIENRLDNKSQESKKNTFEIKLASKKEKLYIVIASMVCVFIFMAIVSFYIISSYRALQ